MTRCWTIFLLSAAASLAAPTPHHGQTQAVLNVGERLVYQLNWGLLVVGHASMEVTGIENVGGYPCYRFVANARTSGVAEKLYPVKSTLSSWMDYDQFFSRRFLQERSEGSLRRFDDTRYDYEACEAVTVRLKSYDQAYRRENHLPINEPFQDILSSVFWLRSQPLALNKECQFALHAASTNYTVTVKPDLRRHISTRATGSVPALRIEPKPALKLVAATKGRMWVWFSDDERRLPLQVVAETSVGSIKLTLTKIEQNNLQPDRDKKP
jgi:hypothetical protein